MESPLKNNPDQQAASVQLPWLEQQQRDREALAAETDQAPPQEPTAPAVAEQEFTITREQRNNFREVFAEWLKTDGNDFDSLIYCLLRESHKLRRPAAPVAVGETPETDAKWQELMHSSEQWPRVSELLRDCARNLERQLAVARRERDEARSELQEYVTEFQGTSLRNAKSIRAMVDQLTAERDEAKSKLDAYIKSEAEHTDALAQKSAEALEGINALAAERDELRHKVYMPADWCCDKCKFTWHRRVISAATGQIGAPIMEEVPTCPNDGEVMRRVTWVECAGDNQQAAHRAFDERDALAAERDRLREDFANFRANIRQALFSYWPNNLGNTDEEIVGATVRALTALATAQAEAAADKRRLDYMLSLSIQLNGLKYGNFYLAETREGIDAALHAASTDQIVEPSMVPMPSQFGTHPHDMAVGPCACGATHKLTDWPKAVRDALDAASATEGGQS